jgi:hypothetical protein
MAMPTWLGRPSQMLSTLDATAWVRQGDWRIYLYPWHRDPRPRGIEPLDPGFAADSVEIWFPIDDHHWYFTRDDLCRLYEAATMIYGDLYMYSTAELREWLKVALEEREIIAYEVRLPSPVEAMEVLGRDLGIPETRTKRTDALVPRKLDPTDSVHVFASGDPDPLPDAFGEGCPDANFRSEGVDTASPEVLAWLRDNVQRYRTQRDEWNYILGRLDGGGFLLRTTRVITLKPPCELWRFVGKPSDAYGGWWSHRVYNGDVRQFSALPPMCSGQHLIQGKVTEPIAVLEGLGAPRCTNKPGGPPQIYIPYQHWGIPGKKRISIT